MALTEYEGLFARAPEAMIVFDDDGTVLEVNERATELFGVPEAEMVGKNLGYFGPPGYDLRPGIRGLLAAGANRGEFRMTRGNGAIFDAEYSSRANVLPGRHLTIISDISDRKRLETSLRSSEQLFARTCIAAPAAIAVVSLEHGTFLLVNEEFLAMTGYWRSEVVGNTFRSLALWSEDDAPTSLHASVDEAPRIIRFTVALKTKDGVRREVLAAFARTEIVDQSCNVLVLIPAEQP